MSDNGQESFSSRLRWRGWINVTLAVLSVLSLAGVANYLAHRHFDRTSWAQNLNRELSTRTVELLKDITNEVKITIFYDKSESTYRMVEELLKRYVHKNSYLTVVTVDPEVQSDIARDLLKQYRLPPQQSNVVIFDANNQSHVVTDGQLSRRDPRHLTSEESAELPEKQRTGLVFERTAFLGERLFTSAIQAVSTEDKPIVYYVKGHGEHSITNRSSFGYSEFGEMLGEMNTLVYDLELNSATAIPANCDLLVLAGPKTELNASEKRKVEHYLSSQGGRMLMLMNHHSHGDLQDILVRWGVYLGDNTVRDPNNTLADGAITLRNYWQHPVVRSLKLADLPIRLTLPRTVFYKSERQLATAGLKVNPLVITSDKGRAYKNFMIPKKGIQSVLEFENARLPLAVAVEKDPLPGVHTDNLARIVVVGDSYFLSNRMIDQDRNRDFGWHSINWLLNRSHMMRGIGPKPITNYRFEFRESEFRKMSGLIIGVMPAATILFGLMVWLRRRG